jgi:hypothetical protein
MRAGKEIAAAFRASKSFARFERRAIFQIEQVLLVVKDEDSMPAPSSRLQWQ